MADIVLNRATYIEFPNNPEIVTHNVSIESGSLLLEEILCEGDIVYGSTNATRFEATVYNLQDVAGLKIKVYQTDIAGNNRRNLFEGYVDSCKQDRDGRYRKLVAYDALYSIGKANVAGWWFQFWEVRKQAMSRLRTGDGDTEPTAYLWELRESLCDYAGIPYETNISLHNDMLVCTKTATLSSVSFNTMLFWICEIQATIPHIDRDGTLRFLAFSNKTPTDLSDSYERNTSEFEGYVTASIDAVELYDYDNELIATTNETGAVASKNTYVIKDNSLLFSLVGNEEDATHFVKAYHDRIRNIRYTPCEINMIVSDLDLSVGDFIKIDDRTSIILQNTLSGILFVDQEIRAAGSEYTKDSDRTATAEYLSIEKKTDKMKDDIITDDLLNYAYMNNRPLTIDGVVTPIIALSINMPKTSNLVFLCTINLESFSTETREVRETVTINGEECEMVRTEKVPVVVEGYFEWNGAEILSNKPTEIYRDDGKHLLNLMFFTIGGRQFGDLSTFKVFLKVHHGRVEIGTNQINATIISKGSTAGSLPWDGTITVEEPVHPITVSTFTPTIDGMSETISTESNTPETSTATDNLEAIAPQFGNISIGNIDDAVESTIN